MMMNQTRNILFILARNRRGLFPRMAGLILAALLSLGSALADGPEIIKVLPHLLDEKGRHTLSPSLFERDAYQVFLRENPDRISALRFDIQYEGKAPDGEPLRMRIDIRGSKMPIGEVESFETEVKPTGWLSKWAAIRLSREDYERIGRPVAWRVTLWAGERKIAEQQSFLW